MNVSWHPNIAWNILTLKNCHLCKIQIQPGILYFFFFFAKSATLRGFLYDSEDTVPEDWSFCVIDQNDDPCPCLH